MANRTLFTARRPSRSRHERAPLVVTQEPPVGEHADDRDCVTGSGPDFGEWAPRTGRSLAVPDQLAELCLAFEIRQNMPRNISEP
jgi:hypothetical protein